MTSAPNTHSTLTLGNGTNKTSVALSTNILITVNGKAVGAVQSINVKETRSIKMVDEVGTDGSIDSSPISSTKISGGCTRVRFDGLRIAEAFSRGFVHVASQAYPFDIVIMDRHRANADHQITTVIKNVWMSDISYTYTYNDWIISEQMSWEAERIYSFINGNKSAALGGAGIVQVPHMSLNIEQYADTGRNGQGGSLDAGGLIDLDGNLF